MCERRRRMDQTIWAVSHRTINRFVSFSSFLSLARHPTCTTSGSTVALESLPEHAINNNNNNNNIVSIRLLCITNYACVCISLSLSLLHQCASVCLSGLSFYRSSLSSNNVFSNVLSRKAPSKCWREPYTCRLLHSTGKMGKGKKKKKMIKNSGDCYWNGDGPSHHRHGSAV